MRHVRARYQIPRLLHAVVYLAGVMVPNGMSLLAMLRHESMSSALAPGLFVGDPAAIGATRISIGSADEAYRSLLKASFCGDVPQPEFEHAVSQLHCDESNAGAVAPSKITRERFGTVPRHYIRCTRDRAIPLAAQDHMIATVDAAMGGKTTAHFVLVDWSDNRIAAIRDFLFAPYVLQAMDWVRLG